MSDKIFETLTPENAALLLIDHQVGTLGFGIKDIDPLNLKNNTLWLAEAGKAFELPVVLTTSNSKGTNGPLLPELIELFPDHEVYDRVVINAWKDKRFAGAVKKANRKKLIMAGVTSDVCLTFPALSAVYDGYDVYAVLDASGATNQHSLIAATMRMSQAGVKMADVNMVVAELQNDYTNPASAMTFTKLYRTHLPQFGYITAALEQAGAG